MTLDRVCDLQAQSQEKAMQKTWLLGKFGSIDHESHSCAAGHRQQALAAKDMFCLRHLQ
jgi:hypothetical protein